MRLLLGIIGGRIICGGDGEADPTRCGDDGDGEATTDTIGGVTLCGGSGGGTDVTAAIGLMCMGEFGYENRLVPSGSVLYISS